jgi:hypothetical protein
MIVCPVCEHAQAEGAECEVCGKVLLHGAAGRPAVAPVEGLEPTLHGDVAAAVERIADLEPTRHGSAPAPPPELPPDLEATRVAPVVVAVEALPDVERISDGIPEDAPTAVPAFVTCRYCRTPAMPGERVCGRCGMRLASFEATRAERSAAQERRCSCGAPVRGSLCPGCGARNA